MTTSAYPGYIYIGSPYTHKEKVVRERRAHEAKLYAAYLHSVVLAAFSPIVHGHCLHEHIFHPDVNTHEYWMAMDLPLLDPARELHVLMLDGWEMSKGLGDEIARAMFLGKPIRYVRVLHGGFDVRQYQVSSRD